MPDWIHNRLVWHCQHGLVWRKNLQNGNMLLGWLRCIHDMSRNTRESRCDKMVGMSSVKRTHLFSCGESTSIASTEKFTFLVDVLFKSVRREIEKIVKWDYLCWDNRDWQCNFFVNCHFSGMQLVRFIIKSRICRSHGSIVLENEWWGLTHSTCVYSSLTGTYKSSSTIPNSGGPNTSVCGRVAGESSSTSGTISSKSGRHSPWL